MPDYSHLQTDIADTRYVMAAHFLEPCQHIVEVGGNRIRHFMRDEHPRDRNPRHFWSIDPSAEAEHWERARTYNMPVTAFNFGNALRLKKQNGLCLLGLEMYDENEDDDEISSIQHVCENAGHFDRVVIEFVESNRVAKTQALLLYGACMACDMVRSIQLETRWERDHKYQEPNASFGKTRKFWVLEKP